MQDLDIPPEAEESIDGAVGVVRKGAVGAAEWAASTRSIREFLRRPWITATARR